LARIISESLILLFWYSFTGAQDGKKNAAEIASAAANHLAFVMLFV
jgi:hypothetical protein